MILQNPVGWHTCRHTPGLVDVSKPAAIGLKGMPAPRTVRTASAPGWHQWPWQTPDMGIAERITPRRNREAAGASTATLLHQ